MVKLAYTYVITKPSGREFWRFRRGSIHTALPGSPGDAAFHQRYGELMAMCEATDKAPDKATFEWLCKAYETSAEYKMLRDATQLDYTRTLQVIITDLGDQPYRLTTPLMIKAVRDDYAATPRKAHKIKQMVSRLYTWAGENGHVPLGMNPAADFKKLRYRSEIVTPWSDEEITLFLSKAPKHLKTVVMLALYTGQRIEDVVTMDWTAYQGAYIRVRQSKTGEPLDIACHKALRTYLDGIKTAFKGRICRAASGRPYTANAAAKAIYDCNAKIDAMPANRSPHGLRYAAAGRLEEAGVPVALAIKVLGHRTYQMAVKYLSGRRDTAMARDIQERRA